MEVEKVMEKEASPRTIKKVVMRMITAKVVTLAAKISSLSRRNENLNYLLNIMLHEVFKFYELNISSTTNSQQLFV